jgi:hypothetical protein
MAPHYFALSAPSISAHADEGKQTQNFCFASVAAGTGVQLYPGGKGQTVIVMARRPRYNGTGMAEEKRIEMTITSLTANTR